MANKNRLLALLDRPNEPLFIPKGDDQITFNLPDDYLEERYKNTNISNRWGSKNQVNLKPITLPNLELPMQLGKTDQFSTFVPYHQQMAGRLIDILMGLRNLDDLESCAAFCRQNMNPQLFNYAFTVTLLHREDTKGIDIPPLCEFFPDKFMASSVFSKARQEANLNDVVPGIESDPIEIPMDYTASDLDEEHRVAYFREDLGINLHHWHWHLVYPFNGPRAVVDKDRRGELFYFMHQQLVGRYNFERLCNKLARVEKFTALRDPVPEGYFPKLDSLSSSRVWPARTPNTTLKDINREVDRLVFDIQDLERWRDRLYEAVSTGQVVNDQGQTISLQNDNGVNILGNILEASNLSPNRNLYGDTHNLGHVAIALSHDPNFKHLETFGVMGDAATAMRDPIFYRWHAFIDDVFQKHKQTLPPYTNQQLEYPGMRVTSIEVNSMNSPKNQFSTFWQQNDVNLSRGMDFAPRGNVFARFTHLQHRPFEIKIQVANNGQARQGTVRIFLAPTMDERGVPFLFNDQRRLMIELDRFVHNFQPKNNTVTRRSNQSSLIIPFERTFRDLNVANNANLAEFNYCGCGWPEHMLIPKGTPEGFPCTLFVMVSNYADDRVDIPNRQPTSCEGAMIFCGMKDSRYPDKRPMGYPFDRMPRTGVDTMRDFLLPNMFTQDVVIRFSSIVEPPGGRQGNRGAQPPKRN